MTYAHTLSSDDRAYTEHEELYELYELYEDAFSLAESDNYLSDLHAVLAAH